MAGLELRTYEHTVPGVFPTTGSFTWLYINFVLSLFDCNFFPPPWILFWSDSFFILVCTKIVHNKI